MKTKVITAANIVGMRAVRYGVAKGQTVELVSTATYPVFSAKAPYAILEELGVKIKETTELGADSMAYTTWKPKQKQKIPEEIKRLFPDAPDPIGRFEGLVKVIAAGLSKQPLQTYSRGYKTPDGEAVSDDMVKRYMVAEVGTDGVEKFVEFPYLEKTHFMPIVERGAPDKVNVIPLIYLSKFLPEGHYEMFASDDAGRFALHNLAQRYLSGEYVFPNGEKGEAMIIIEGYHATSGTTQEYYVLLWAEYYTDKEGNEKFIWRMMSTKTRIKYANGMPVPLKGEVPKTVQAQKRLLTPSVAVLLDGVV